MAKPKDYIGPLVIVWKTSNRSNAQTKIKKTSNYNLDYFLQTEATIPGIPKGCYYFRGWNWKKIV
jgi:hypothetical protein